VADLIVYDQAADLERRVHAIGHQFGHMLLGHQARHDGQHPLFPNLEPALTSRALTISRYAQADELEADDFASLVVANCAFPRSATPRPISMKQSRNR
jgi:hypothetical protein